MRRLLQTTILLITIVFLISCGGDGDSPTNSDSTTNGGNGNAAPEITSIQPDSGPPGTMVTIDGTGFSPDTSTNSVTFGGTVAPVNSASESTIETTVPDGLSEGSAQVEVTVDGETASGPSFTVEQAAPGISSVEPDSGTVGTEVIISGMNFSATASENSISFAGTDALVNSASETELITKVPQGATDGPVEVTVKQKSTTGPDFNVITEGAVEVTTNTTGSDKDTNGYTATTSEGTSKSVAASGSVIIGGLAEGDTDVELTGIADNCKIDGNNPKTATITAGDTTGVSFDVSCQAVANNQIVFYSFRDGTGDIFKMNTAASNIVQLTNSSSTDYTPVISNDGTRIAFVRNPTLYTMDSSGNNVQSVPDNLAGAQHPAWSPDDSKIAFEAEDQIYTISPDGSGVTQITSSSGRDTHPSWSPDGSEIVFSSNRDGDFEIYTINVDGTGLEQLTNNTAIDTEPAWGPNGSKIAFESDRDGDTEIFTMNTLGAGLLKITDNTNDTGSPSWSPDGSQLVYHANLGSNYDIYKIIADGTGTPVRLTTDTESDFSPHWSPVQ